MSETKPEEQPQVAAETSTMDVDAKTEAPAAQEAEASTSEVKAEELGPLPKIEGKEEAEVDELLVKAAKQSAY